MRYWALLLLLLAPQVHGQQIDSCGLAAVYDPCEIRISVSDAVMAEHPKPYSSVTMRAEFRSPKGGRTKVMPAFWDGGGSFVLRFSPDHEGRWDYRIISDIDALDKETGSFMAEPARTPGFITIFHNRYFKYPLSNTPHYWLGDTFLSLAAMPWDSFRAVADKRAEQGFTHVRALVLGTEAKAFQASDQPDAAYFRELDKRVAYLHGLGLVTDLVLADSAATLERLFPTSSQRERFVKYVCSRYAAYSVTWQSLLAWEDHPKGGPLAEALGKSVARNDPYDHPRSTGALLTSSPLFEQEGKGWQNYIVQNRVDPALASIEYETYPAPFVNTGVGAGASPDTARKQAWSAAVRGQYVTLDTREPDVESSTSQQMAALASFFAQSRYFDMQPHYRVVGGAGLAFQRTPAWSEKEIGIEYIVHAPDPGTIELVLHKHEYKVSWYDPATGAWFDQKKKFKGDRFRTQTPDKERDWVLYVRREGKKQAINKSYFLESRLPKMKETEVVPANLPFAIQLPAEDTLAAGRSHEFNATLTKNTIAAQRMLWLWTAEIPSTPYSKRVLGTGQSGKFNVPALDQSGRAATLAVRLVGVDGAGRLFEAFKSYALKSAD